MSLLVRLIDWGLRDYGTATWEGGDPECEHKQDAPHFNGPKQTQAQVSGHASRAESHSRDTCPKCGARRIDAQIGLERTPDEYVEHLVAVMREVLRVLRKDGTCWLNIGDSYFGGKGSNGSSKARRTAGERGWAQSPGTVLMDTRPLDMPQNDMKPKDLVGIPWRVAFALQADGWWLRSDIIWAKKNCLGHSVRVYAKTQKGEMPMTVGEMVRLTPDTVQLWTGERWAQVRAFTPSAETTGIEIALRSGQRIPCTAEHLWPTERGNLRADALMVGDRLRSVRLPAPETPDEPGGIPDRFGWAVGFYLAEGSRLGKDDVQFAMHSKEDEALGKLREFGAHFGSSVSAFDYGNVRQVHLSGGAAPAVLRSYIWGDGCKHKHLTTAAWQRTNEFIYALLLGYLDGDGHLEGNRWRLGFTRNDALADDLRTMTARLGMSLRLKRTWFTNQDGKFYGWRGDLRGDFSDRRSPDTEIVGIQRAKGTKFYDVTIDAPHIFALASGVLTHNCMPESVTDRPTRSHEYVFLLTKSARYYYDAEAVKEELSPTASYGGTYKKQGKIDASRNDAASLNFPGKTILPDPSGRNLRDVWHLATQPYKGAHFAVMPQRLVEPCIKAGTSEKGCCPVCGKRWKRVTERIATLEPGRKVLGLGEKTLNNPMTNNGTGGTSLHYIVTNNTLGWRPTCSHDAEPVPCVVLDPFSGAGTVVLVAERLGRTGVGVELNMAYCTMARERVIADAPLWNGRH